MDTLSTESHGRNQIIPITICKSGRHSDDVLLWNIVRNMVREQYFPKVPVTYFTNETIELRTARLE
jgi:hypothetical protein